MKLMSWNVNGIRAIEKKGFNEILRDLDADVVALQETKAHPDQLSDNLTQMDGYHCYFDSAEKKGYSGVALYCRQKPEAVHNLGIEEFDREGRVLIAHFRNFTLINCYFPNSQKEGIRLDYKLRFCDAVLNRCNKYVGAGKNVVLCGDYNIAHTAIDLKNPKSNEKNAGFLPQERDWMSEFLSAGYRDLFRDAHPEEPGHYTWWSYRFNARAKNAGWRIDYFCVDEGFAPQTKNAKILSDVMGSDHCPVWLEVQP
ncbi:MAG: exodeoxyribonuclease III [Campylobacterota bacterium]